MKLRLARTIAHGHFDRDQLINEDLAEIRAAGFTGIVTYDSQGLGRSVPELARALGLNVIMRIRSSSNDAPLERAIECHDNVDAYYIDSQLLDNSHESKALIQRRTSFAWPIWGRPAVTSSEAHSQFTNLKTLNHYLFRRLFNEQRWVGYDPLDFDADDKSDADDFIKQDLAEISAKGFTGIVISTVIGNLRRVPELAQARGIRVILAFEGASTESEFGVAIAYRENVDAFCYASSLPPASIEYLRHLTRRPIDTSGRAMTYLVNPECKEYDQLRLNRLLRQIYWVVYEPRTLDSSTLSDEFERVENDLCEIGAAGFTGVIVFSDDMTIGQVPRIAKALGLRVILGVRNAKDAGNLGAAITNRDYVDAYCIGDNGLDKEYTIGDLENALHTVRIRTRRPVGTTEHLAYYSRHQHLPMVGDWLNPRLTLYLQDADFKNAAGVDPYVLRSVEQAQRVRDMTNGGRPFMLHSLSFPWHGISGTSLLLQERYFAGVRTGLENADLGLERASVSIYNAFDHAPRTRNKSGQWERFTGLLDPNGSARPAVREVIGRAQ